jgi:fucose 4-O-acetylase-like acetyltransferase
MPRRPDIDLTKGLAILLVVFGHLVARADPAHVDWYEPLRRAIYAFHMPLFLYLSGLLAVTSGTILAPRATWPAIVRARAKRLLLPFFALGIAVVAVKLLAARFMVVDNPPSGWLPGLSGLVWNTAHSPALSIWYLFVLFVVSLASLFLLNGKPERIPTLTAAFLVLYALPFPTTLYLDRIGEYAIFFALGLWAGFLGARWDAFIDRTWPLLLPVFLACLILILIFYNNWNEKFLLLPVGALSMPALHGWLRTWRASSARAFIFLGRYSFMIYLFNTLFIGLTKGLLLHFCSWNGANFLPFAAVLMFCGTLGPVALKFALLRRSKTLDRLTH